MSTRTKLTKTFTHISGCLLVVLLVLSVVSGCSQSGQVTIDPGQEVSIAIGQTVSISSEPVKIKFAEVINDSRCANGVECIWQGEVSCRLEITYRNTSYTKIITQPGLTADPSSADFNDYVLKFKVQPYPKAGKSIKSGDYRLHLTVDKKPGSE